MILGKNNNYFFICFLFFIFSFFQLTKVLDSKEASFYTKSYFGSILSGQIANYNNDSESAAKFFNYAHQINPSNAQLYNLSLMSLLLNGKVDDAIKKVRSYKKLQDNSNLSNKQDPIAELLLFIDAVNNNRNSQALKILNNKKDLIISKKLLPILKSWLSENYDLAKQNLDEYEYKSEGLALSDLYYYHLALISNYHGRKLVSFEAFNKSLKDLTAEKIRTLFFYSNFLKDNKKYIDTNKFIEKFINKNPSHSFVIYLKGNYKNNFLIESSKDGISETIYNLAENLYSQGLYETSIVFCQISLFLNQKNIIAKYLLAQNFQVLNQRSKAINILQSINLKSYLGWNTYLKISDLYIDMKDYESAKKYLLQLKSYKNNRIDVYYKIGELYHSKKDYSIAIQAFTSGIELIKKEDKLNWYMYYSRGMSYERSNKWDKAEKDFQYALKLFPDQPLVLNYLGYSWIDLGKNIEKAQKLIKKAVKIRPNDGYFVDSLGWAYYRMGNYNQAVIELEKAVSLIPNDPIINDHLGDALWRAGFENEAVFQWKRSLLYNPDSDLMEKIRFKLKKGL